MTAMPAEKRYSQEEYLALEREAAYKSEYIAGSIVAMTGASRKHNQINFNIAGQLYSQLRGRPCAAFTSDMRVKIDKRRLYTYPDVVIVCDDPQFEDDYVDTLLNPTVIIEILSPSTEAYDRGDKFDHYRRLPSLREYLLISQNKLSVEQFVRQGDVWTFSETRRIGDKVQLTSVGCQLAIVEIYDKVDLADSDQD